MDKVVKSWKVSPQKFQSKMEMDGTTKLHSSKMDEAVPINNQTSSR